MPSVITHAVVGSALTILGPAEVSTWRLCLVLAILPVIPDLDVIAFSFGIPYEHMLGHRGFTHSILFAFILSLAIPTLFFRKVQRLSPAWIAIVCLSFFSTMSHGLLDAFTDAGLGVGFFIPFDDGRYFFPWRPIATSPLSISAFITEQGVRILLSELRWVGIPLTVLVVAALVIRKFVRREKVKS